MPLDTLKSFHKMFYLMQLFLFIVIHLNFRNWRILTNLYLLQKKPVCNIDDTSTAIFIYLFLVAKHSVFDSANPLLSVTKKSQIVVLVELFLITKFKSDHKIKRFQYRIS
jgi:hypothetical protein